MQEQHATLRCCQSNSCNEVTMCVKQRSIIYKPIPAIFVYNHFYTHSHYQWVFSNDTQVMYPPKYQWSLVIHTSSITGSCLYLVVSDGYQWCFLSTRPTHPLSQLSPAPPSSFFRLSAAGRLRRLKTHQDRGVLAVPAIQRMDCYCSTWVSFCSVYVYIYIYIHYIYIIIYTYIYIYT